MRLYLLPISTRRTLLYCQRLKSAATEKETLVDKVQSRTARVWASWEKKDGGWQRKVVDYGNYVFRRIPYEEWGLKSVPPLSTRRREEEKQGTSRVEVVYPRALIPMDRVHGVLETLGTEREALHRRRLIWCFVGMPITAPIALIPLVPNLPFFYLAYRAWSHWRALAGGKHIQFLVKNSLLELTPSKLLDDVYAEPEGQGPLPSSATPTTSSGADGIRDSVRFGGSEAAEGQQHPEGERMLLSQAKATKMTQALDLPELEVELERAIWQVETAIGKQSAEEAKAQGAAEKKEQEKKKVQ